MHLPNIIKKKTIIRAAAVVGSPTKKELLGIITLNLASLKIPQRKNAVLTKNPKNPIFFSCQKYAKNAGAMQKVIASLNESSCSPISEVVPKNLATLPSRKSIKTPNKIK